MPKALERRLKAEARRKGLGKRRTAAYVYGTLARLQSRRRRGR